MVPISHHAHLLRQSRIKRLSNLFWLTNPTALNDDVVKLLELRNTHQLLEQVTTEGAADAAILEGDDFLVRLGQVVCLLDQGRINIDTILSVTKSPEQVSKLTLQCR